MASFRLSMEETGQKNSDKHFNIEWYQAHHTMEKNQYVTHFEMVYCLKISFLFLLFFMHFNYEKDVAMMYSCHSKY